MTLSQEEFKAIINNQTKVIPENIEWRAGRNSSALEFRSDIFIVEGHPIFVRGWFYPDSGKLSYSIIHRSVGRIYGLDLGAQHRNPDGQLVGETHKNFWREGYRDKWAYSPEDITAPWNNPFKVWEQFCAEANLVHSGTMSQQVE